jgi:hypothetical protein
MIPAADFMNRWHQMEQTRTQLDHIVRGARDAILKFQLGGRHQDIIWENFEMTTEAGKDAVVFPCQYYWPGSGGYDHEAYVIPLEVVLAGEEATTIFFQAEKIKQEEKARELGRLREQQQLDIRRVQFLKLKAEFEPVQPLENIIAKS